MFKNLQRLQRPGQRVVSQVQLTSWCWLFLSTCEMKWKIIWRKKKILQADSKKVWTLGILWRKSKCWLFYYIHKILSDPTFFGIRFVETLIQHMNEQMKSERKITQCEAKILPRFVIQSQWVSWEWCWCNVVCFTYMQGPWTQYPHNKMFTHYLTFDLFHKINCFEMLEAKSFVTLIGVSHYTDQLGGAWENTSIVSTV